MNAPALHLVPGEEIEELTPADQLREVIPELIRMKDEVARLERAVAVLGRAYANERGWFVLPRIEQLRIELGI